MHPGFFSVARKAFLETQRALYNAAYEIGDAKNCIANVFRRYCKRFPRTLPEDVDPSQEELEAVRDDEADEEDNDDNLDLSSYPEEERAKILEARAVEARAIKKLKARIQRWLNYRYIKDHAVITKREARLKDNPFYHLFLILDGKRDKKPSKRSAINVWSRRHSKAIEARVRARIKKEMFDDLDQEDKDYYEFMSKEELKTAIAQWEEDRKSNAPSTSPEARQRCIDALNRVIQPLLDAICEATGWKVSLIAGGPEPARGGQLGMKMIHSGTTSGEVKMDFGRAEHERLALYLYPMFADFMKKCYSVKECQSRALHRDEDPSPTFAGSKSTTVPLNTTVVTETSRPQSPSPAHTDSATQRPPPPQSSPPSPSLLREPRDRSRSVSGSPAPRTRSRSRSLVPRSRSPSLVPRSSSPPRHSQSPSPLRSRSPSPLRHSPSPRRSRSPSPRRSPATRIPSPHHTPPPKRRQVAEVPGPSTRRITAQEIISRHLPLESTGAGATSRKRRAEQARDATSSSSSGPQKRQKPSEGGDATPTPHTTRRTHRVTSAPAPPSSSVDPPPIPSTSSTSPPTVPTSAKWFDDAIQVFLDGETQAGEGGGVGLGDPWVDLVEAYSMFQRKHGFADDKRLPNKGWPGVLNEWIHVGRTQNKSWRPRSLVVKDVEGEFKMWWNSLQPEWRVENGVVVKERLVGDWSSMIYPGINRLLSVVAALFFWGLEAQQTKSCRNAWLLAVNDCHIVLNAMCL
ncbi:hypothetical protein BJ165DRAFT_1533000 [Panaeolus papilionaceus]|nr:hypothetical protein BJ165DRAFT_1533000 [Panaeolus papilionaceus]